MLIPGMAVNTDCVHFGKTETRTGYGLGICHSYVYCRFSQWPYTVLLKRPASLVRKASSPLYTPDINQDQQQDWYGHGHGQVKLAWSGPVRYRTCHKTFTVNPSNSLNIVSLVIVIVIVTDETWLRLI